MFKFVVLLHIILLFNERQLPNTWW